MSARFVKMFSGFGETVGDQRDGSVDRADAGSKGEDGRANHKFAFN